MRIDHSVVLGVDPGTLWPWLSTPERLAQWIREVQRFETRPAGELGEGSRLIVHLPRGEPFEARVERVERGRELVLRASGLPSDLEALLTFTVRDHEEGSVLTLRAETELKGLMMFAEKMIASKARAKLESWMEALREATGSARPGP